MRYQFTFRTTAADLWQLSMYHIYGSMVGVCNVIFTVAVILLTFARWDVSSSWFRVLLVFGCVLFPVLQPLAIYQKAKKQASGITMDTRMMFGDKGVHVEVGTETTTIPWKSIGRVSKKPTMIVVFSDTTHGFILTNRVLGKDRDGFYEYVQSRIRK